MERREREGVPLTLRFILPAPPKPEGIPPRPHVNLDPIQW
jgi:hypothetical protein